MLAAMASWSASVVELSVSLVAPVETVSGNSVWSVVAGIEVVFSILSGSVGSCVVSGTCMSGSGKSFFLCGLGVGLSLCRVWHLTPHLRREMRLRLLFCYRLVNSSCLISFFSKIYEEMF